MQLGRDGFGAAGGHNNPMRVMRYYRAGVLAVFQSQAEKYNITIDEFEGKVQLTYSYYREAEARGESCYMNVAFGFRACRDGEWAVAAYAPDLAKASPDEQQIWTGFLLGEEAFPEGPDERFTKWADRYLKGSWDVPETPFAALQRITEQINAVTFCIVGVPLFTATHFRRLCFPLAENNHRYHDAHSEVYKLAIDGLSKDAIAALGQKLGIDVKPGDKTTLNALERVLTESVKATAHAAFDKVAAERRLADHKQRPAAVRFSAFEQFAKDMAALVLAFTQIRDDLARRLDVNIDRCEKRASAMQSLPEFDPQRPAETTYAIFPALSMIGKQVTGVRAGELVAKPGRSKSEEAIVLEFAGGSLMSIEAGTNITQVMKAGETVNPEDVSIRLFVNYVPPLLPFGAQDDLDSTVVEVERFNNPSQTP